MLCGPSGHPLLNLLPLRAIYLGLQTTLFRFVLDLAQELLKLLVITEELSNVLTLLQRATLLE
jgi:hypothetical protein